ncbi:alginate lyase family protein [Pleomorphovibrio marinus]|uniref:alginate lyase family protein n=1 Tax=Pleomorphovibrio marinus TaxID=2164132 RepID=UPI001E4B101F|nr:alginate lyase family protein [Pleomorphovibrio marinus]
MCKSIFNIQSRNSYGCLLRKECGGEAGLLFRGRLLVARSGKPRRALHSEIRLSEIFATLTSAWLLTEDLVYSNKTMEHLNAWFVDTATMMNPHLLYAQK